MTSKPELIDGGIAVDDRGSLSFVNGFDFKNIKRFYHITNSNTKIIRAFHGHLKEDKYFYVPRGCAKIICIPMKNKDELKEYCNVFYLSDKQPRILKIPKGYANGMKVLEKNTDIIVFSSSTLEESKEDDYRFDWDILSKEIWETENR